MDEFLDEYAYQPFLDTSNFPPIGFIVYFIGVGVIFGIKIKEGLFGEIEEEAPEDPRLNYLGIQLMKAVFWGVGWTFGWPTLWSVLNAYVL